MRSVDGTRGSKQGLMVCELAISIWTTACFRPLPLFLFRLVISTRVVANGVGAGIPPRRRKWCAIAHSPGCQWVDSSSNHGKGPPMAVVVEEFWVYFLKMRLQKGVLYGSDWWKMVLSGGICTGRIHARIGPRIGGYGGAPRKNICYHKGRVSRIVRRRGTLWGEFKTPAGCSSFESDVR